MPILTISEKILFLICGLGTLQGILLALLVYFHPKSDRSVNKFLALFIFFFSVVMTMPFIIQAVGWQNSFFIQPFPLLTGPFLYFYIRSFKETITLKKVLPHLLLFFVFFFPVYWNISFYAHKYPDALIVPAEALHDPLTILMNYIKFGTSFFYFFYARKTLKSCQRSVKNLQDQTKNIDIKWLSVLIHGYMIVVSAAIIIFSLILRFPEQINILLLINMSISTPYIYIATYKGILQPTIWQLKAGTCKETVEEEMRVSEAIELQEGIREKGRAVKAGDKVEEMAARIIMLMEEDKLYQETDLTLQDLADRLDSPCYQVSQAINEGMNRNFYELVNGYRVEEAKRLLLNPKNRNYTVLSVGFEAGFNSKTTFNTVFKKFTGLTPTDFRGRQAELILAEA